MAKRATVTFANMSDMSTPNRSDEDDATPTMIRMTTAQRRRLKIAAAAEDVSYAQMIMNLLDDRDRRLAKARTLQASPLHRVNIDADV